MAHSASALAAELSGDAAMLAARFELIGSMINDVMIPLSTLTDILRVGVVSDHRAGYSLDYLRDMATLIESQLMVMGGRP